MIYLTPCVTVRRSFACVTTNDAGDCATHQSAMLMTNRSRGMNTALSLVTDLIAALHDYEVSVLDYLWHSNPGNNSNPSDPFFYFLWEFKWLKSSVIVLVFPIISLHDLKWCSKATRRERSHLHELFFPRYVLSFSRLLRMFPAKWDAHPYWNVEHFFQKLDAAIVDEKISKTSINWFYKQRTLFSVFCFSHMTGYHSLTLFSWSWFT